MRYPSRLLKLVGGLFLFSLGTYMTMQANIGLAPWSAFNAGVSARFGTTFGTVNIVTALVIIVIDMLLHEHIGVGTVLDAFLVGIFIDWLTALELLPLVQNYWLGLLLLLAGLEVLAFGSWLYMSAALGEGPRDMLMVALCKRFPKTPVGVIRCVIEGAALIVGWLLGAKVGLGTVISVFGTGAFIQLTFNLLHFEVKDIHNESIVETCKNLFGRKNKA